jgi:hypothetical protein
MATQVMTNARVFVDGLDYSGQLNAVAADYGVDALDATTFASGGTRANAAGLFTTAMNHSGYWDAGVDAATFAAVGNIVVVTVTPNAPVSGEVAFIAQTLNASYQQGAAVGELLPFDLSMEAAGPLVRAAILETGLKSAGGNSTARNLGAVAAGRRVYAALHVLEVTGGGTLAVKIQSDDASGFASPIDQITFANATGVGGQYLSAAGAITDSWWRANYTLSAGTATFIVSVGII